MPDMPSEFVRLLAVLERQRDRGPNTVGYHAARVNLLAYHLCEEAGLGGWGTADDQLRDAYRVRADTLLSAADGHAV